MKRILVAIILIFLLAGCDGAESFSLFASPPDNAELEKLILTATAAAANGNDLLAGSKTTETPGDAAIRITAVTDGGAGEALVTWEASGEFPNGFKLVYSDSNPTPTFPEDAWVYYPDPAARQGSLTGEPGKIYAIRVCRYTGDACDTYSEMVYFKLAQGKPEEGAITLTQLVDLGGGKMGLTFKTAVSSPKGYKVVWSQKSKTPTYPDAHWGYFADPDARTVVAQGEAERTYHVRICKFDGEKCTVYSNTMDIKTSKGSEATEEPGESTLAITSIVDYSSGRAIIRWRAEGSFPNGFKVAWSKTNPNPSYPGDTWVYLSDPNAREAMVEGTPGSRYYFRVCKFDGSGCAFYSASLAFTFSLTPTEPPAGGTIEITSVKDKSTGKATVRWAVSGSFPNGFKVVWSSSKSKPTYPEDHWVYMSDPGARSAVIEGTPGKKVYIRVCQFTGSACGTYSPTYTFTSAAPTEEPPDPVTITITSAEEISTGRANVYWTVEGTSPNGFKLAWSSTNPNPSYPDDTWAYYGSSGARSGVIEGTPGVKYYIRVCQFTGSACGSQSNVITFTFPAAPTEEPTEPPTEEPTEEPTEAPSETPPPG